MLEKHYDKYQQIGLNIAFYRKKSGMSQSTLAEKANISRTHMSRVETADCAISLDTLFQISEALNITPEKLLEFR